MPTKTQMELSPNMSTNIQPKWNKKEELLSKTGIKRLNELFKMYIKAEVGGYKQMIMKILSL